MIKKIIILASFACQLIMSEIKLMPKLELTNSSAMISISSKGKIFKSLYFKNELLFFHINHPTKNLIWYNYTKNNFTYLTNKSIIEYGRDNFLLKIGRDQIVNGYSKIFGLSSSPTSPSLDQLYYKFKMSEKLKYKSFIARLDNRPIKNKNNLSMIYRWYYYKELSLKYNKNLTIGFYDGLISTGEKRSYEWYYMIPFTSFFMERKHEPIWSDNQDTTSIIGVGDNDNHFIGLNWLMKKDNYRFYGDLMIDEYQLDKNSRDSMQTVFGFLSGLSFKFDNLNISVEYALASPHLYLNRAVYGSLEKHLQPLGLHYPQSQSIGLILNFMSNKNISYSFLYKRQLISDQYINSKWNAWDNRISITDTDNLLPDEYEILIENLGLRFVDKIGIYFNYFQSAQNQILFSKSFKI
jgi:hypothetical protein